MVTSVVDPLQIECQTDFVAIILMEIDQFLQVGSLVPSVIHQRPHHYIISRGRENDIIFPFFPGIGQKVFDALGGGSLEQFLLEQGAVALVEESIANGTVDSVETRQDSTVARLCTVAGIFLIFRSGTRHIPRCSKQFGAVLGLFENLFGLDVNCLYRTIIQQLVQLLPVCLCYGRHRHQQR